MYHSLSKARDNYCSLDETTQRPTAVPGQLYSQVLKMVVICILSLSDSEVALKRLKDPRGQLKRTDRVPRVQAKSESAPPLPAACRAR